MTIKFSLSRGLDARLLAALHSRVATVGVVLAMALAFPTAGAVAAATNGFYTVTPCRLADTRDPVGPFGGPALAANTSRSFTVTNRCGIPSTAEAVAVNVTVTGGTSGGDLRLYATGYPLPGATGINYAAGRTRANNGSYALSSTGGISIHCDQTSGSVHVILDVFGYFETVAAPPPPPPPPPPGGGPFVWSRDFGGPTLAVDSASPVGVAVDGSGSAVVFGYLKGKADFGGGLLTSAGSGDVYLARYSSTGSYQWAVRFGGTEDDRPKGVAVDLSGNVYITGYFRGSVSFGGGVLTAVAGSASGFLAKYSATGAHIWSKRLSTGVGTDTGDAIAVDGAGNILVGASLYSSADYGGGAFTSAGGQDIVLVKYSSSGSHVWSKHFGGSNAEAVTGIAVDPVTSDVVAAGYFAGTVDFGGGRLTSAGGNDVFLARYSSSSGAHLWSHRWGGASEDKASGVSVDQLGSAVVTGMFTNSVDFGGGAIANTGGGDIFLAKYSLSGAHLWSKGFGSSLSLNEMSYGVDFDASGNVLLTGGVVGTINFGGLALTGDGWYNAFVAKFGADGTHAWSKRYPSGSGNSGGRAIAADASGNVYATGDFDETINLGGATMTSPGAADTYMVKFGP